MQAKESGEYVPKFYMGWKILILTINILIRHLFLINKTAKPHSQSLPFQTIYTSLRLRKKLYLTKIIKFHKKFYSTPIIPSWPSEAFKIMVMNGGYNFQHAGTELKKHIDSVFIAITNQCSYNCSHCYEKHNLYYGEPLSTAKICETITILQKMGVSIFILTGGEPLTEFEKVEKILLRADHKLSEFHIHTSGKGLTNEKAVKLKQLGITALAVGVDHYIPEKNDQLRGNGSFKTALNALKIANESGIMTYVNLCATTSLINSNGLWHYFDLMKNLNVSIIQLLEPRPCGGFFGKKQIDLFTRDDRNILLDFMKRGNTEKRFKNHPLIYYVAHIEGAEQMGCMMGGLSHFYIDSKGNVNPCVFMPVTFGNINQENIQIIFEKMRKLIPFPLHSECPSLELAETINKKSELMELPLRISEIKNEWNNLYLNSSN